MAIRDNLNRVQPGKIYNDAFWVGVERAPQVAPGAVFYQVALIHHLTPEENGGNHNAYADIIDESGALLDPMALGVRIGWTWKDRNIYGEPARPYKLDKQAGEPAGNLPLFSNMLTSLWITTDQAESPPLADASSSEKAIGLRLSGYPPLDGEGNNRPGHNSYYIVFRRVVATAPPVTPDPPVVTPPAGPDVLAQLADLRADFAQLARRVQILEDKDGVKG